MTERLWSIVGAVALLVLAGAVVRSAMQVGPVADSGFSVEEVSELTIASNWAGFSVDSPVKYTARILCPHRGDQCTYTATLDMAGRRIRTVNQTPIHRAAFAALVTAMMAPVQSRPTLQALGIQPTVVAPAVRTELERSQSKWSGRQWRLVDATLGSAIAFEKAIVEGWPRGFHTDDYPWVCVRVKFRDGRLLLAQSNSQQSLMVPWELGNQGLRTFEPAISRAIASLLPSDAPNVDRLRGPIPAAELSDMVQSALYPALGVIDAEDRIGSVVAALRSRFELRQIYFDNHDTDWIAMRWGGFVKGDRFVHAVLHRPGTPDNLEVALLLDVNAKSAATIVATVAQTDKVLQRVLESPFLMRFVHERPSEKVNVRVVDGVSFGPAAQGFFAEDMHLVHRPVLLGEVRAVAQDVTLVETDVGGRDAMWLLLPRGRLILWYARSAPDSTQGLMLWHLKEFAGGRCEPVVDDPSPNIDIPCIGQEVTEDGKVLSAR